MIPPPLCPSIGGVATTQEDIMRDVPESSIIRVATVPPRPELTEVGG